MRQTPCFSRPFGAAAVLLSLVVAGCKKPPARADAPPAAQATTHAAAIATERSALAPGEQRPPEPSREERAPEIERVEVPLDRSVLVVGGEDATRPIVFLHGMCARARPALEAWAQSVSAYGTILALEGEVACAGSGTTWRADPVALDHRIQAAIDAVSSAREMPLRPDEIVLVGVSLGASRAMSLAERFRARYTRLVLVGAPETPSPSELDGAEAVALLAGEKEPQTKMREGARLLDRAGRRARFWEMPGATHGAYGPAGSALMKAAVAFVLGGADRP